MSMHKTCIKYVNRPLELVTCIILIHFYEIMNLWPQRTAKWTMAEGALPMMKNRSFTFFNLLIFYWISIL